MATITVTETRKSPMTAELILDGQRSIQAVSDNGHTVADLLNAVFTQTGQPERVVVPDKDGNIILGDKVFTIRDGAVLGRTVNGNAEVRPGDRVVVDRKHTNG